MLQHPHPKKIWGQIVKELVRDRGLKVAVACRLFGHCRQAFYQLKADLEEEMRRESLIVKNVREILLRRHRLMLPPRKKRHTTDSNHRYHKWKNLISGLVPTAANQIWVADITYIDLADGQVCYLHLITDAYSRKVVGWMLADTLRAAITLQALEQAIEQAYALKGGASLEGLIHHSDRGVQYCCDDYVSMLQKHRISISMTEDYKPTDNAIAERVNGIIKEERIYRQKHFESMEHARDMIGRYIHFYNNSRPHMSIGYKVPAQAHLEQGEQKRSKASRKGCGKRKIMRRPVVIMA